MLDRGQKSLKLSNSMTWSDQNCPTKGAYFERISPPNIKVDCSNPRGLKCDDRKGYIGSWIYPEYFVAWTIPVVGFDC